MTTTTAETFKLGSLILNTLGYNIDLISATIGSHARKPNHVEIPRRAGVLRLAPTVEPTKIELSMWVTDRDVDGVPGGTGQMWSNLDLILSEVGTTSLVALQKVRQSSGGLLTLDAEAEVVGPINWSQIGPTSVSLTIPMIMPYPYWEGASSDQNIAGASGSITNDGHAVAQKIVITLEAGGSNWVSPVIENVTAGVTLTFAGTVDAGQTYTIDFWEGTAVDDLAASITGSVTINGTFWPLVPGSNSISVSQVSGTGTFRTVFDPPYIA